MFSDARCHGSVMVDAARLTGWVNPGEIWQSNFWIWFFFKEKKKLCRNSVFYEKMNTISFILCRKVFIFLLRSGSFPFCKCIPLPSLSNIDILWNSVLDLKISTRLVTVDTFNWLKRKDFLFQNMHKK